MSPTRVQGEVPRVPSRPACTAALLFGLGAGTAACDALEPRAPTLSALRTDIFEPRCNFGACHGSAAPARGLDLQSDPFGSLVDVASATDPAIKRVVPGEPDASLLLQVLIGPSGGVRQMPLGAEVTPEELEQVRAWIEAGAAND